MKRILILTVTAGNGHNACAKGMKEKLESIGGVEVKVVDLLKSFSTPLNVWTVDKGYNIAVGKLRPLYNLFYEHYKRSNPKNRFKCKAQSTVLSVLNGLLKEIYEFKPDVIYGTHFYAGMAITNLRLVYDIPCKVIISNLDYVNSPFWEACIGVDYFAIPNKDFVDESIEEGFKKEQLLPVGLPVNEKFIKEVSKTEARKELGIGQDTFTIMIMFGGGHWGGGFKILKQLLSVLKVRKEKTQLIMINGKNKSSFEKVKKLKVPENINVLNVGFTDKVDLYMSASDVVISKVGGPSSTEMINKGIPVIATEKLPAQEKYNLIYLKKKGIATSFKNSVELKKELFTLIENKELYKKRVEAMKSLKTNGIDNLAKIIMICPRAKYNDDYIYRIDYNDVKFKVKKAMKKEYKKQKKTM